MNAITTTTAAEPAMLGFLQRAVSDPSFDTAKFEVVLGAMREEQAKHAEREFYHAMAVAQGQMEPVRKDAFNPHTKKNYASFEAIDSAMRPVYTDNGFSVSYRTGKTDQPGVVRMICTVAHAGGHAIEAELTAALDSSGAGGRTNKTDVQAVGSTVSYLRRYLLSMVFNVALAGDDDDGEGTRRQQQPARTWADDAPKKRPYHERPLDPVAAQQRAEASLNRMSKEELDAATGGDEIPALPPVDKARVVTEAIVARYRACVTEDDLHEVTGDPKVAEQRLWLARKRPELDEEIAVVMGERYDELVRARQEAEAEAPA